MGAVELDLRETDCLDSAMLSEFCEEMLASLRRSDQRRWGEMYVRGLVEVPGRKSIRRMCQFVAGQDAGQALQQFLNQSPWCWAPVRSALAGAVAAAEPPEALVVREVTFPKYGSSSVAVARQYSRSMGRLANCQLATGVFLTGGTTSSPVNWRLHIPREWDGDTERRGKSRVPESERWRPSWQIVLDALDEMAADWSLPRLPVVLDLTADHDADLLLDAFEARGTAYLARVSTSQHLARTTSPPKPAGDRPPTAAGATAASPRPATAQPVRRREPTGSLSRSPLAPSPGPGRRQPGPRGDLLPRRQGRILADWDPARPRTRWLTNMTGVAAAELARTARTWDRSTAALHGLEAESGLQHFEGRSFRGWHHHVTLVALAHGFRRLSRTAA